MLRGFESNVFRLGRVALRLRNRAVEHTVAFLLRRIHLVTSTEIYRWPILERVEAELQRGTSADDVECIHNLNNLALT